MFTEKDWGKSASSLMNEKFITIQSYSGYSLSVIDFTQPEFLFDVSVSDEELGKAVVESLKNSRFLELEKARALRKITDENYPKWISRLMEKYDYKTKRTLFKNMLNCSIELEEGTIIIGPSHHDQLEGWSGNNRTERNKVLVPFTAPHAEIGAALRLAFSRCTSKF
jgi:hypothetical protein